MTNICARPDVAMCRTRYQEAQHALQSGNFSKNIEEVFRPIEEACLTQTGQVDLPFRLVFSR